MRLGDLWIGALVVGAVVAGVIVMTRPGSSRAAGATPPPAVATARLGDIVVYKSPTCGCCDGWIEHLRANGFQVVTRDTSDVGAVKDRLGVLPTLVSCHTAIVAGYVIEGHVPARDIVRLLEEKPKIVGLAVPGMPAGSPGMESAQPPVPYDVVAFDSLGRTSVWSRH